jgi:hypothetical protein
MFIPFVFTLATHSELHSLWIFYKYLGLAKKFGWPIISQEKYFEDPVIYAKMGMAEASNSATFEFYEYEKPTKHDIDLIQKYVIPDSLFDLLTEELGSHSDVIVYLLKNRYEPLEQCLRKMFQDIKSNAANGEIIEGILTFNTAIISLKYVAKELNIPIIYNEWGPLRPPCYRKTAYFDFKGTRIDNELEYRFDKFNLEIQKTFCPILNRKEILSLFLDYKYMNAINRLDSEPEFEIGVAMEAMYDYISLSKTYYSNFELILMVRRNYLEDEIIFRPRPGDLANPKYYVKNIDDSESSMNFILKCKKVAVVNSNLAFEAMLLGKTVYTTAANGVYNFKATKILSDKNENIADLEFINFVVFGYLIPYELLIDVKYLRWRLTNPSEIEIYNYHLDYYLSCRGVDKKLLGLPPEQRLYALLESQGFDADGKTLKNKKANKELIFILKRVENLSEKNIQVKYLFNKVYQNIQKNKELENGLKWHQENDKSMENALKGKDEYIEGLKEKNNELYTIISSVKNYFCWKINRFVKKNKLSTMDVEKDCK